MAAMNEPVSFKVEAIATALVDAAFIAYCELGPGLPGPMYGACLCVVLNEKGHRMRATDVVPAFRDES